MMAEGNVDLTERIAQAVVDVPGVAFLRPGLVGLLRATVMARMTERANVGGTLERERAKSAVRVRRVDAFGSLVVEVSVVLRRGHRAVDVTRAVQAAAAEVVPAPAGGRAHTRVTVTVTGLV